MKINGGRLKIRLVEVIKKDILIKNVIKNNTYDGFIVTLSIFLANSTWLPCQKVKSREKRVMALFCKLLFYFWILLMLVEKVSTTCYQCQSNGPDHKWGLKLLVPRRTWLGNLYVIINWALTLGRAWEASNEVRSAPNEVRSVLLEAWEASNIIIF